MLSVPHAQAGEPYSSDTFVTPLNTVAGGGQDRAFALALRLLSFRDALVDLVFVYG